MIQMRHLILVLVFPSIAAAQQRPWDDVGFAAPAAGYAPDIQPSGVTRPGQLIEIAVSGAEPNSPGTVYVGSPAYASIPEGTLVPASDRVLDFVTDASGAASRSFVWPANVSSQGLGVQALVGGALSRAIIGRNLSAEEAVAYSAAVAAASGWDGVDAVAVAEALQVQFRNGRHAGSGSRRPQRGDAEHRCRRHRVQRVLVARCRTLPDGHDRTEPRRARSVGCGCVHRSGSRLPRGRRGSGRLERVGNGVVHDVCARALRERGV